MESLQLGEQASAAIARGSARMQRIYADIKTLLSYRLIRGNSFVSGFFRVPLSLGFRV
jgi:hypothetical protein